MLIEDYGLIGDLESSALVGRNGAIDWLCVPRFDSPASLAALLGTEEHGQWLLAPTAATISSSRRYRAGTLILETDFACEQGRVRVTDFMPCRAGGPPRLMRIVEGLEGAVPMSMVLRL